MSEFAQRQFSGFMVPGTQTDPAAVQGYLWQQVDVPPKYILQLAADGKANHQSLTMGASASYALPLPGNYTNTNNLVVILRSDQTIKAVTVSSLLATSTIMIRAGLKADQNGLFSCCQPVTSITLTNPQAVVANVEYIMYELPDITTTAAWRIGSQATGIQGN